MTMRIVLITIALYVAACGGIATAPTVPDVIDTDPVDQSQSAFTAPATCRRFCSTSNNLCLSVVALRNAFQLPSPPLVTLLPDDPTDWRQCWQALNADGEGTRVFSNSKVVKLDQSSVNYCLTADSTFTAGRGYRATTQVCNAFGQAITHPGLFGEFRADVPADPSNNYVLDGTPNSGAIYWQAEPAFVSNGTIKPTWKPIGFQMLLYGAATGLVAEVAQYPSGQDKVQTAEPPIPQAAGADDEFQWVVASGSYSLYNQDTRSLGPVGVAVDRDVGFGLVWATPGTRNITMARELFLVDASDPEQSAEGLELGDTSDECLEDMSTTGIAQSFPGSCNAAPGLSFSNGQRFLWSYQIAQ